MKKYINIKEGELEEICNLVRYHKGSINEYNSELLEILQTSDEESKKIEKEFLKIVNII